MRKFEKLELSVETLRELTEEQLGEVAGGAGATKIACDTTYWVPSNGGAWTMACPDTGIGIGG